MELVLTELDFPFFADPLLSEDEEEELGLGSEPDLAGVSDFTAESDLAPSEDDAEDEASPDDPSAPLPADPAATAPLLLSVR